MMQIGVRNETHCRSENLLHFLYFSKRGGGGAGMRGLQGAVFFRAGRGGTQGGSAAQDLTTFGN